MAGWEVFAGIRSVTRHLSNELYLVSTAVEFFVLIHST